MTTELLELTQELQEKWTKRIEELWQSDDPRDQRTAITEQGKMLRFLYSKQQSFTPISITKKK